MKKAFKIVVGVVVAFVLLVLALVLTLPLWLGPVVKPSANAVVPQFTKTPFHLGLLSLNPYTGRFELGDLQLGNPEGYSEKQALTLNRLAVDVAMDSLTSDTILVEEVTVDGVFVSYVSANGVNNFDQIQYNVAGGKEKYEANKAKAKAKADAKAQADAKAKAEKPAGSAAEKKGASKKVAIGKLVINDIKLKLGPITLPVPSITLTDIGKKSNGVTMAELFDQILQAILKAATAAGDGIKAFGGLLGDGAKSLGTGTGKAATAVGESTSKAVDAVGDGAKKAADAVGDGAKKTMDALKSLF